MVDGYTTTNYYAICKWYVNEPAPFPSPAGNLAGTRMHSQEAENRAETLPACSPGLGQGWGLG